MWAYIEQHINFKNKSVLDIGAGYCDLAIYAAEAGARRVTALENNRIVYTQALAKTGNHKNIRLLNVDAELFIGAGLQDIQFDVAFCTSVLPYLRDPWKTLGWMAEHAHYSIIECQYISDGPPGQNLKIEGDAMMESRLRTYSAWDSEENCKKIGETSIEIRPGARSIWLCTRKT
jgi:SAM-dependent methyltransferase